jgi:hypothetical protein
VQNDASTRSFVIYKNVSSTFHFPRIVCGFSDFILYVVRSTLNVREVGLNKEYLCRVLVNIPPHTEGEACSSSLFFSISVSFYFSPLLVDDDLAIMIKALILPMVSTSQKSFLAISRLLNTQFLHVQYSGLFKNPRETTVFPKVIVLSS